MGLFKFRMKSIKQSCYFFTKREKIAYQIEGIKIALKF